MSTHWGLRPDLEIVANLVPTGSRVLDLGCGDGTLLDALMRTRDCRGTGVERDPDLVLDAIGRGVPLVELDLDTQLDEFADASYDVVVLSRTLQTVRQPQHLLAEMARIAPRLIVSMPNFGLWRHRLRLGRTGQGSGQPGRQQHAGKPRCARQGAPPLHRATCSDR